MTYQQSALAAGLALVIGCGAALASDSIAEQNWKKLDTNSDGKLTMAENRAQADAMFKQVDSNHDGALSREEYLAAVGEAEQN